MTDVTFPTASDLLLEVQNTIGEVAGTGVQQFSEDATYAAMRRAFDIAFIKRPWENYIRWGDITIDGVTGKCTELNPFGDVRGIEDFIGIYRDGEDNPLPLFGNRGNPNALGTGTMALTWAFLANSDTDYTRKRIQVYPKTSVTVLNTCVRLHPGFLTADDRIYLDPMMIIMGTAWQVLDADGTNGSSADTCKQLFDLRFRDINHALAGHPIALRNTENVPMQWFER